MPKRAFASSSNCRRPAAPHRAASRAVLERRGPAAPHTSTARDIRGAAIGAITPGLAGMRDDEEPTDAAERFLDRILEIAHQTKAVSHFTSVRRAAADGVGGGPVAIATDDGDGRPRRAPSCETLRCPHR
jgi:hypothetical protein